MNAVIILPTYNEKENIIKLIELLETEIFPLISTYHMAILVADDMSPDGTEEAVKLLMKKWKNIAISSGTKKGLGAAYIRAMNYAIEHMDADVMFEMDADGQHDEKKIPLFLKKIDEGYDMVVGTRYSSGGSIPTTWGIKRKAFSVIGNIIVRTLFFRFNIHDWTGGFRAVRKEVFLKEWKELRSFKGYTFQVSFLHKAVRDGFKVAEVPFHFRDRTKGTSKIESNSYIIDLLKYVITARIKELAFGKFGKFLAVGGFGFVVNAIALKVFTDYGHIVPELSNLIGAALAIFSNYNLNNIWTFKEQKITSMRFYIPKLLQFYLTSAFGVIFIQTGTIKLGDMFIGQKYYFTYFLVGTALLLVWNFFIYNKFIWRNNPEK